jgi:hypothetical protein
MRADPKRFVEALPDKGGPLRRAELVEELCRVEDPHTEVVLEALGDCADKLVAKAARRALFRYRTDRRRGGGQHLR